VAVVRASNYGAGIGDPARFPNAAAAYRAAGLVPTMYESAGRSRSRQHISREGSVELRQAIIELGRGLSQHEADFRDYRRRLLDANKAASVAAVAVGHRAHRLAFAMLRDQKPYDPDRWAESVAAGMTAMAKTRRAHQNDVTCPPPPTACPKGVRPTTTRPPDALEADRNPRSAAGARNDVALAMTPFEERRF
jgi:hypothetical protein